MLKTIKNKIANSKLGKYIAASMFAAVVAAMGCMSCFAADGDPTISSQLTSAFSNVATDITGYALIAIPSAAVVFGLFFGVRKIFSFFKSIAK